MTERGFRASVDDAGNAVGEIGDGPTQVVLLGHIDTVPGEIDVRIEAGELIGRGAVDAKGPLAAFVAAATKQVAGLRVTVVGAVEEESPTSAGARYRATLGAPDWCVIGEPSGWDAVTVAYKGRLALRVSLSRAARHGAAPGMTCSEEALALWSTVRAAAERRSHGTDGFARLDCRLEGMNGGSSDGLIAIAEAGGKVTFKVKSGTSDMNVLAPAWGCPMVAYGPGDSRYDHTPMERLSLSDYERSIRVLESVLARAPRPII